ncbi:MAG: translation initiation factor IF-2 [Peptococcaceae bacterium]|jgi:translation initiation factor IF-2|nr:translation initiation factor IF-2 [Peptococcaceae bacterium]MDH7524085.1 translation initiation factor IF-2 [Peptococcaceae bacterium]
MATIRVHELARDMNMSSKELLDKLQDLGLNMKNHMSTIPSGEVNRIKNMVLNLEKIKAANKEMQEKAKAAAEAKKPAEKGLETVPPKAKAPGEKKAAQQHREERKNVPPGSPSIQKQQYEQRGQQGTRTQREGGQGPGFQRDRSQAAVRTYPGQLFYADSDDVDKYYHKAERALGEKAYERGGKTKTGYKKPGRFDDKKHDGKKGGRFKGGKVFQQQREQAPVIVKHITLEGPMTVQEFAHLINKKAADVIKKLLFLGVPATINQELDVDTLILLGEEFGTTVEVKVKKEDILLAEEPDKIEDLVERPPVVTIMGHVDHGKTSLLDVIRQTNVVAAEAGGITQHIGAYQVEVKGKKITFLDTPGHEAFTAMRARGARVTDIAILVVAADDGVMPQTVEAINHAQAAGVQIIVAINKIDKPEANPERVKQELTEHGLVAEEWGGETICVNVSAKTKAGLETLLEMILLMAEVADLKANPKRKAKGTVIEAQLDKARGPVATLLVQNGTLEVGDFMIVGATQGRVRAMYDDKGRRLKKALPSTPVEVIGLSDVPQAGDIFQVVEDERLAKQIASERTAQKREEAIQSKRRISLEDLFSRIQQGEVRDLNIILKADVQGSIEALKQSLEKLSNEEVRVNIIHQGVGGVNESDVMLADASNAIIIGFNVRPDANARKMAENQQIDIRLYRVIYNAIEDVKAALSGLLKPEIREVVQGQAEVRATFKVPKIGTIAGCYVTEGKITRGSQVRVIRDGIVVHEGTIGSLKRFKDDVREVASGYECGIGIEKFNDVHEGDRLEFYTFEEIKRELS